MLMTTTGTGQDITDAGVRALFDFAKEEQSSRLYYSTLCFTDSYPDVPEEKLNSISGPGKGILTVEGEQYGSNDKTRGYPVTLSLNKYTSELSWTEEDIHWLNKTSSSKMSNTLKSMASHAINALYQNINEDACKVYYLGFGTTNLTVGNSEGLIGSHTIRKTGGSQRNDFGTASTHQVFDADPLKDALNIMNRFKAMNNIQLLPVRNVKVVAPTELVPKIQQIIYSNYGPAANLAKNISSAEMLKKRGINIDVVCGFDIPSTYSTYWWLVDMDRASERHYMAWAWKPRMNSVTEYEKGIYKNESSTIFAPLVQGWQHVFGSKGDGTTPA